MEVSTTPAPEQHLLQKVTDVSSEQMEKHVTSEQTHQDVSSEQHLLQEVKDVPSEQKEKDVLPEVAVKSQETTEQPSPPQTEKSNLSSGSAISSLIGGRNCIITTTIVTELTQTVVEPLHPDIQSNGQVTKTCYYYKDLLQVIHPFCVTYR